MRPSRGMGAILPSKMPGAKKVIRKDDPNDVTMYAKGGWIDEAVSKPGALRAQLGVPKGENIPAGMLAKAAKAPGKLGKRARLAETFRKMKK